jgi:hypothetical protein
MTRAGCWINGIATLANTPSQPAMAVETRI